MGEIWHSIKDKVTIYYSVVKLHTISNDDISIETYSHLASLAWPGCSFYVWTGKTSLTSYLTSVVNSQILGGVDWSWLPTKACNRCVPQY